MSELSPPLREIKRIADELRDEKEAFHLGEIAHRHRVKKLREALDAAMVAGVDWGKETTTRAARAAGYASSNAVGDARKRINARNTEVR